jgi:hypothetical protein
MIVEQASALAEKDREIEAKDKRIAELEELRIMQLAAISTASIQNTETTIKDRINADNPYCSTAYLDVCRVVDREMTHRERLSSLQALMEATTTHHNKDSQCMEVGCWPGCPRCAYEKWKETQ